MKVYKTRCINMQVLLWESQLDELPVQDPNFKTFVPEEGDLALVDKDEYVYSVTNGWTLNAFEQNE